jgi:hypothetical protein
MEICDTGATHIFVPKNREKIEFQHLFSRNEERKTLKKCTNW